MFHILSQYKTFNNETVKNKRGTCCEQRWKQVERMLSLSLLLAHNDACDTRDTSSRPWMQLVAGC